MTNQINSFKIHLLSSILDAEGVHHEFASGTHGQKLDFDLIESYSELYVEWVDITTKTILNNFNLEKFIGVIGVANGTNRLALSVATKLGCLALPTYKVTNKSVALTRDSKYKLSNISTDESLIILEDVGTTGSTVLSVARGIISAGYDNVECLVTWQRTRSLGSLASANVPYKAIISEQLPTYTPNECETKGFCSQGWNLIKR